MDLVSVPLVIASRFVGTRIQNELLVHVVKYLHMWSTSCTCHAQTCDTVVGSTRCIKCCLRLPVAIGQQLVGVPGAFQTWALYVWQV